MVNYANGKIYKIVSTQLDKVYIGSTSLELKKRLIKHRNNYKKYIREGCNYASSFEILKYEDAQIILIEDYPCTTKKELFNREQYYKRITPNIVNKVSNRNTINEFKDYKNGKIYKIFSKHTNKCYIGSTTNENLQSRLNEHKNAYNRYKNKKTSYVSSYDILQYNDCEIVLVENYTCNSKEELEKREGIWTKTTPNCVNKCIPGRTIKEYRKDNAQKIKKNSKEYAIKNKEKLDEYRKQYISEHKEKHTNHYKDYYQQNKEMISIKHKEYYNNNKQSVALRGKRNRQVRKEYIKERRRKWYAENKNIKLKCECGCIIGRFNGRHRTTPKHINRMQKLSLLTEMETALLQFNQDITTLNNHFMELENAYNSLVK